MEGGSLQRSTRDGPRTYLHLLASSRGGACSLLAEIMSKMGRDSDDEAAERGGRRGVAGEEGVLLDCPDAVMVSIQEFLTVFDLHRLDVASR